MADLEKLMALKKAYAEIILNTAKEAAAKVMMSELNAERYRREAVAAKDEALQMLLRLKHMLESKFNEAEMKSEIQSKRIELLEAQLGEAEDIVKDLRSDLREVQDRLEHLTNRDQICSCPKTPVDETVVQKNSNELSDEDISKRNSCRVEQRFDEDESFFYVSKFANEEHRLYRNGCTHRVQASGTNIYGGSIDCNKNIRMLSEDLHQDKMSNVCSKRLSDHFFKLAKGSENTSRNGKDEAANHLVESERFDVLTTTNESDIDYSLCQTSDRILKYTFRRKRKREIPGSPDGNSSIQSSCIKENETGETCELVQNSGLGKNGSFCLSAYI